MKPLLLFLVLATVNISFSQAQKSSKVIYNGVPWYDQNQNIVNAHGACIVEEAGRYYLFGEWKSDESNAFPGFSCYSSADLVHWKFERVVLPVQPDGILGPDRVGERVKVMKCPATGEYVMYMHADNLLYKDPHIGYATSKTIDGEYTFRGPLLYQGKPIRRWDMGTYQDADGTGYLLLHGGIIYRLSSDYRSAEEKVLDGIPGRHGESPAMFRHDGIYYFLFSNLTSWEKNDNFYYTAPSVRGPWTYQGLFAPEGTLTYNSQTTFVLSLIRGRDTVPMFMGDRWSFPHQASAATYVWMPMQIREGRLSIPTYWNSWNIQTLQPVTPLAGGKKVSPDRILAEPAADWTRTDGLTVSHVKDARLVVLFKGKQIAFTGETNRHGGYARIKILNADGGEIFTSLIDFYSKTPERAVRFISPRLPRAAYTLVVEVTGISPRWFKKSGEQFGSDDCYINVGEVVVF